VANYNLGADWNGLNGNLTTVGSAGSTSAYGTFDQAGNLDEFTETLIRCETNVNGGCNAGPGTETDFALASAIVRGGTWAQTDDFNIVGVRTGSRDLGGLGGNGNAIIGFRVAAAVIPEPSTFAILLLAGGMSLVFLGRPLCRTVKSAGTDPSLHS